MVSSKNIETSFMEVIEEDHDSPRSEHESEVLQQEQDLNESESQDLQIVIKNPFKLEYVTMQENPFVFGLEEQEENQETLLIKLTETERRLSKEMDQIQNLIGLITNS